MKAPRKMLASLGAGLCLVAVMASPMAAQTFTDTTEVTAVEIPVQVVVDGKPVRGLEAKDFVVYQEKKKQDITGFEVVDLLTLPADKADEVPAPARRHFLLLFDMSFSEPKALVQARSAAKDLLKDLHPSDLVAVATYAASRGPELVLGFTPDRPQVEAAVDTLGLPELIDRSADPLKLVVAEMKQDMQAKSSRAAEGSDEGGAAARKAMFDAIILDQMEQAERAFEAADVENQKRQVVSLTRSFTDLARLMSSVQGRKYVVYLSEGFDSSILTGTTDKDEQEKIREAQEAGEFWKINSDERYGQGAAANEMASMLEAFRRADCIVQSVDIGGLRAGSDLGHERKGGRETLFQMASDTGGDLFENFNDLSAAMGKMLERTGVTYVLTIQPAAAADGKYHPLKVELRRGPKGAKVVHRSGYFGPRPFAQQSRIEKLMMTAGQVLFGEESGSLRTSVLATPLPGSGSTGATGGTADVPVLIEVDGPSLLHLHEGNDVPTEIYVYAVNGQGKVSDYLAQTLSLDLLQVERKLLGAGLKFYGHLELPPGTHTARVLVRNGRTGRYGLKVLSIDVPKFDVGDTTAGPVLLPPFFPETQGEWLITREAPRPGRRDAPLPFRLGDEPFLPASLPVLDDARETRFALIGYNLDGELQVRSQVLTADGREVDKGSLALVGRAPGAEGEGDRLEMTFRPAALQPGEYLLRVTVTDAAGKAGTSTARFVVAAAAPGERS